MVSRLAISLLRVVCVALLAAGTASAATVTSNSGFGLDWNTPATWQGGQVPASGDDVVIAPGSSVTIAAAATINVNSITVQGGTSISPSQSGSLTIDGTLNVTNAATMQGGTPGGTANITVNGTLNAGAVNVNGGAGDASGTGGAATLSLNASTAAVNIGGNLSVTVINGAFTGGAATVNFPATGGMLDVNGNLNVTSGTLNLSNGTVELAGNFIGDYLETINAGGSTIKLNGTAHQHWIGNSHTLWNLTVTNTSAQVNWDFTAVTLDSDITVDGVLTMSGGTIYNSFSLVVSQVGGLTHNSGHISGSLVRNVAGATPTLFPVGTSIPLFATITPSSSGLLQVLAYEGIAWGAGANAIDAYWELIGDPSLTSIDAVTFNYGGTTVTGTEASYVIARQDYTATPATWQRYATTLNTVTDVASMTTTTPLLGYWTIAEPAAVTTATQIVLSSLNYGLTTRKNTPFDLIYEARDGQGNPATFSQYTSFELSLGPSVPGPTGTLTDIDNSVAPIAADATAGDQYLYINNLLYTAAETVNLQLSEVNATPTFATLSTSVTFAVPATGITITSTEDDGPGTLRHAINTVNSGGCSMSPCPVDFQLPVAEQRIDGTWSIQIQSSPFVNSTAGRPVDVNRISGEPMPSIFSAMAIDATTQSGYNPANPKPVVAIDFNGGNGLVVDGSSTTIRGLALHHASDQAITLQGTGNHVVEGCYIGLYASGASDNDTATGIAVTSSNNTIGGTTPAQRNVISGNWFGGIELLAGASQNQILGNYIGTDPAGTTAVPNFNGIILTSASDNRIGGAQAGAGNVIAGNDSDGILIDGTNGNNNFSRTGDVTTNIVINNAAENKIEGNAIGYGATGAELLNSYAVSVQGDGALDNVIGGPSAGQGNTIAGGISLQSNSLGTAILGNTIDTTLAGIIVAGFAGNDAGDADVNTVSCFQPPCVYANNGQNTPEISAATLVNTTLQVTATVDSASVSGTQSIRVEVFAADDADTLTLIGNGCYDTNFPSNITINIPNAGVAVGDQIYATATSFTTAGCAINDPAGNHLINDGTSQFSAPATVSACTATTPTISASGATSFCNGGSVTLTASAGSSYSWKKNGVALNVFTQQLVVNASGSYSVTVTDGNGCPAESAATTVTVFANPPMPPIGADSSTTFCQGGSVVLRTSPGATSYQWFHGNAPINGANSDTFTATLAGNYTVTAFDANGCSATSSPITVTVNPAPATPTISPSGATTFCQGGSVVLTSSPATTYQWLLNGSPIQNATAQTFTASATGNYSVVAGNGSCTATSAPIAVTVNPAPATPTVTPNGPTSFCTGGSVVLTSSPAASYQWLLNGGPIQNATAQTFTATAAGNYSVTVFDANTCSATSAAVTVTVNAPPATPTITPNGPTTFCQGSNVVLTSSAASAYQWLLNGTPIQNATAQSFTATATGNYSVVAGTGSCTATSAPVAVTVHSTATPTITAGGPTTFCQGGSVTLTASATTGTYQWLKNGTPVNGANSQTFVANVTGNFTVTVTENNCPATSAPVSVTVTPFTPALNAPSTSICPGGSVTLSASAGTAYQWYFNHQPINGAMSQTYTATQPGDYKVFVENNGCSNFSAPVTLTAANATTPSITASGPATFCEGGQVTLSSTAAQSYQWNRNGTPIANATQQTYAATTSGSYTVTTTSSGCPVTSQPVAVTVNPNPFFTILAPASVTPGSSGNTASIDSVQAGVSYAWSITGGTIDGPATGPSITFTAGNSTVVLTVVATLNNCTSTQTKQIATVATFADLSVTKSGPATVEAGAVIDYTIVATNHGPAAAANLYLTDVLPDGTTFIHADSSWPCVLVGGSVVCRTSLLPAGGSETIHITVNAPRQAGSIVNSVSINADTADPSIENNEASAATIVTVPAPVCATEPPSLVSPANGASVTSPATFSWTAVIGATSYELWTVAGTATTLAGTTQSTSLSVSVPSGTVTWYVIARLAAGCDALVSAQRTITVAQTGDCSTNGTAQLTAPVANTVVSSPVAFAWTPVPNATGYRVWISVDGGVGQDIASTTGATTVVAAVPPGSIAASIETLFSGCPSTRSNAVAFTVPAPDPCATRTVATPIAPSNNATIQSSSVDFRWSPAAGAKEYRLWAAIDGGAPAVLGTTTATELRATIARGEVLWWVESLYTGCASTESQRFRFTIPAAQNCGTARPDTLAPANGATVGTGSITFTWSAVSGAIGYELWLAHNDGTPSLIGTTTATSLTAEVPAGTLQWFVRVLVDRCPPRDSQTARFTYTQPAGCDTNIRPTPAAPVDNAQAVSPVDFTWGASAGATKYELYVARGNGAPSLAATTAAARADAISLANGSIRWFVRAYFAANCPPLDSAEQQLQIVPRPDACAVPTAPVLSAPGQITSGTPFRIQWSPVPAATSYQLQLSSREDFAGAELITTSATEHDLLEANGGNAPVAVYARVRAVNSRCATAPVSAFGSAIAVFILPPTAIDGGATATDRGQVRYTLPIGPELAGQSFVATSAQPFITFQPASGIVPAGGMSLVVLVDTSSLPAGTTLGSVTLSFSTPGSGRVTTNATTVTTPISVNLVTPVTPTPKNTPPPDALIIPAVAHANGINSQFQSDIRVSNTSPQLIKYQLTFTPSGDAGISAGRQTTFSIDPGRTVALDDVLKSWFGTGTQSVTGTLEVRPRTQTASSTSSALVGALANLTTFASSRTFNVTPNGTFGQYIPAIPFANFIGKSGAVLSLQQIAQSAKYRTNLGLVEGSGESAQLLVRVFGANGQKLTEFPVSLNGGQHLQLNAVLATQNLGNVDDGRIEVQVTGGNGKVTAYASVLDNQTSDPLLVTPVTLSDAGNTKWVVPGVADLSNGAANWQSDIRLFNAGTSSTDVTLSFHSMSGGAPKTATITLQPGEVRQLDRALSTVFGVTQDGGALHLETATAARLVATARTYNQTSQGTYGQFISAVTPAESVAVGSRPLQLLQVEESTRYRSNIGLAEVTGKPVTLEVSVIPPDSKFTATTQVTLAPNEFRQITSMLASLGLGETYNARITVRAVAGEGRATAYASVIDLKTQDPTYVPAQ